MHYIYKITINRLMNNVTENFEFRKFQPVKRFPLIHVTNIRLLIPG